jgi:hypothetical protein
MLVVESLRNMESVDLVGLVHLRELTELATDATPKSLGSGVRQQQRRRELTTAGLGAVDIICGPLGTGNEVKEKRRKPLEVGSQNNFQECGRHNGSISSRWERRGTH